jgi:hypothetical protein
LNNLLATFSDIISTLTNQLISIDSSLIKINQNLGNLSIFGEDYSFLGLIFFFFGLIFGIITPIGCAFFHYIQQVKFGSKINIIIYPFLTSIIFLIPLSFIYVLKEFFEMRFSYLFIVGILALNIEIPYVLRKYTDYVAYLKYLKNKKIKEEFNLKNQKSNKIGNIITESYIDLEKGVIVEQVREEKSEN